MRFPVKITLPLLLLWLFVPVLIQETSARDSVSAQEHKAYSNARKLYHDGSYEQAISALEEFLVQFPGSALVPEAYFFIGKAYVDMEKYSEAVEPFKQVVERFPDVPFAGEVRLQLSRVYLRLGMVQEAIVVLEQEAALSRDPQTRQDLYTQITDLYLSSGEGIKAVETLLKQRSLAKEREARVSVEQKIRQVLEERLDERQLNRLIESHPQAYPGDVALLRLGESAYSKGELFLAERYLNRFLDHFPKHESTQRVRELLIGILERHKANRFRLGVLLPLSGSQSPYAESVLKGIRLAMDSAEGMFPEKFIGLVVRDFEGQSAKLRSSLEELIEEYQSIAIVGPLLTRDVEAVAPLVEKYQIPLITPTATAGRTTQGSAYVFRNAVTPQVLGQTLTEHAVLKSALKRFVIFYPKDTYGFEMMKVLSEQVNRLGGEIIAAEAYPPDSSDFSQEIKSMIRTDLSRYGVLLPPSGAGGDPKPEYVPGFDAVFLLGDALKTGMLAAQLAFHDVKDRVLLVTSAGNYSKFLSVGNRFVEGAILVEGFFEESTDPMVRSFVSRYQAKYQESPDLFSAQAYDCVQMILLALKSGAVQPDQIRDYLAQVREFHGASGVTTFHPNGQLEKKLFVLQVRNGRMVQVN